MICPPVVGTPCGHAPQGPVRPVAKGQARCREREVALREATDTMAIDDCPYTFRQLTRQRLPQRMRELRRAMRHARRMGDFARPRIGPATLLREMHKSEDFCGCYVLIERRKPFYVGISRRVVHRLIQHVRGRSHYDASLAYRIACGTKRHSLTRRKAMQEKAFKGAFQKAKDRLRRMKVAFVEINDPVELHLFEVYCAMELHTGRWNTFRTH